jgi:hypothetical protein
MALDDFKKKGWLFFVVPTHKLRYYFIHSSEILIFLAFRSQTLVRVCIPKTEARMKNKSDNKFGGFYQQINSSQFLPRSGKVQFTVALPQYGEIPTLRIFCSCEDMGEERRQDGQ